VEEQQVPGEQNPEEALRDAEQGFADIAATLEQALATDDELAAAPQNGKPAAGGEGR